MFGLTGVGKYLLVAVIILTAVGYVLFNSLTAAKAELSTAKATIGVYKVQIQQNIAMQKSFEMAHNNIVLQYQALEEQYKKDASREHVAVAKPTLVQKLANKRFKKQEREMACLTGNKSKC